uniref:Uncharacterized protein n=1 Tax=Parascaris univalens TaxID=6257 RepID=A0A914ZU10_PARUN
MNELIETLWLAMAPAIVVSTLVVICDRKQPRAKKEKIKQAESSTEDKRYQSTSLQSAVISESLKSKEAIAAPEDRSDLKSVEQLGETKKNATIVGTATTVLKTSILECPAPYGGADGNINSETSTLLRTPTTRQMEPNAPQQDAEETADRPEATKVPPPPPSPHTDGGHGVPEIAITQVTIMPYNIQTAVPQAPQTIRKKEITKAVVARSVPQLSQAKERDAQDAISLVNPTQYGVQTDRKSICATQYISTDSPCDRQVNEMQATTTAHGAEVQRGIQLENVARSTEDRHGKR